MISNHQTVSPKIPKIEQKFLLFYSGTDPLQSQRIFFFFFKCGGYLPEHPPQGVSEPEYPSQDCSTLEE